MFDYMRGTEMIAGAASITLSTPRAEVTVVPFTDGVNTGWFIG